MELAELREDDVDLENGYLRVMGKGSRERYIPFGQKVAKVLFERLTQTYGVSYLLLRKVLCKTTQ